MKSHEVINRTDLTEVQRERSRGNTGNHSNLDNMGFPKRFNYTRATLSPDHLIINKHTVGKPLIEVNANTNETMATLSALIENESRKRNKQQEKETRSELEKEEEMSGWKARQLEIIVGATCGFLLVSIMIILLYRRRMKKLGKIEVTISQKCAYRASTNECSNEIKEI